ncbi:ribonuclease E inhibitor RraA [Duganella sp. BJB488]|uniref:ribonuclease E activity regulator RraA n=1 Tax=unclassified Duganella TaxID=2636909 RepID=UPI000E340879|nr:MULTISPECIES: ribonuclease E activity regulator RraA [unclassified Duganella]RFP10961.1 ribonuclease E inhibitor RraA [Duganella sp. BJB489]RFP14489.1 ribonuclease E inhibitor RraA [Duganella sp. BJB488]RFP30426.1 ribonuclease E inhibitor RraA [Duganella sp. BJB480]
MSYRTAEIVDAKSEGTSVVDKNLHSYGAIKIFHGPIFAVHAQNSDAVRQYLNQPGNGRVLVVDAGAEKNAIVGLRSARMAFENGWRGIIVNGFVRDTQDIRSIGIGVIALGATPQKAVKASPSQESPVTIGDVKFTEGKFVYVDEDGVVVLPGPVNNQ